MSLLTSLENLVSHRDNIPQSINIIIILYYIYYIILYILYYIIYIILLYILYNY